MKQCLTIGAGFWQFCQLLGVRHLGKICCNNRLLCRGGEFAKQITAYSSCARKWKDVKQVWHAAGRTIQSGVLYPSWPVEIRTGSATTLEPPAWNFVPSVCAAMVTGSRLFFGFIRTTFGESWGQANFTVCLLCLEQSPYHGGGRC